MDQAQKPSSFYNEDAEVSDSDESDASNPPNKKPPTNDNSNSKALHQDSAFNPANQNLLVPDDASTGRISNTSGETDDTFTSEEGDVNAAATRHLAGFEKLSVSDEIKELFKFVFKYTPQTIQLEFKLKPFNPEFIPAVGDADPFIKIPRPDKKFSTLGLTVLDEPSGKQSDPTALDLQLRVITKTSDVRSMAVKTIENAIHHPELIKNWIRSVEKMHKASPSTNVLYSKSMPDTDYLMQEWPAEFEELLSSIELPSADLSCSVENYIDVICNILDIPVYTSRVHSLHVLFSLYTAFRDVQMFHTSNEKSVFDKTTHAETNILQSENYQDSASYVPRETSPNASDSHSNRLGQHNSADKTKQHEKKMSPALENLLYDEEFFPSKKIEQSYIIEESHRTAMKGVPSEKKSFQTSRNEHWSSSDNLDDQNKLYEQNSSESSRNKKKKLSPGTASTIQRTDYDIAGNKKSPVSDSDTQNSDQKNMSHGVLEEETRSDNNAIISNQNSSSATVQESVQQQSIDNSVKASSKREKKKPKDTSQSTAQKTLNDNEFKITEDDQSEDKSNVKTTVNSKLVKHKSKEKDTSHSANRKNSSTRDVSVKSTDQSKDKPSAKNSVDANLISADIQLEKPVVSSHTSDKSSTKQKRKSKSAKDKVANKDSYSKTPEVQKDTD